MASLALPGHETHLDPTEPAEAPDPVDELPSIHDPMIEQRTASPVV